MRKTSIVRTLISLAVLFSGMVWSQEWKQLPMRTKAQKAAGLMGGDGAQQVMDIAYAPSNPKIAYLVADTCQVWKSIDSGFSWKLCNKGFNTEGGFSIVIDPNNEKIVFAAGCIGRGLRHGTENTALSGIYRTTNDGQSWRMVKQVLFLGRNSDGKHQGKYFAFDKSSFDGKRTKIIYAGTYEEGFYKTTDGGDNWTETGGFKGKQIYDVKINPKDKRILYLATSEGLFIYNDINQEKSRIGDNLPSFPRTIAINSVNPEIIYAAAGFQGIYWSQDGGKSFKERNKGLPLSEEKAAMRKEYIYVSLSPVNPDYIYASCGSDSIGTFYSHNGGAEWGVPGLDPELLTIGAERGATRFFAGQIDPHPLDANKALMLANGTAGVMKTDDGGKIWNYSSDGYTGTRTGYKGIAFYNDPQKMMFFVLDHGPYCTVDGGDTFQWVSVPRRSTHSTPAGAVEPAEGKTIAAAVGAWGRGDFRQALIVSEDGGQTWEMKNDVVDLFFFIAFHPQNPNVIYAQGYRSDDKGRTFKALEKKVHGVFPKNGDIVYSCEKAGEDEMTVYRSKDRGDTWIKWFSFPAVMIRFNNMEIDPVNPDRIYIGTAGGLYIYNGSSLAVKGEESGLKKDFHGGLEVWEVAADPKHPEIVYIGRGNAGKGHGNGVFLSADHGETWKDISGNLGEITIWGMGVSPHDGTVYIGSSHGTWYLPAPYRK